MKKKDTYNCSSIRHRIGVFLVLICMFIATNAQVITCRYGFGYEISYSPNWGTNKPVITNVQPFSPAQRAGLKQFDIIEEVEGAPITEDDLDDIHLFLNPEDKELVEFTIRNISDDAHKVKINKECKNILFFTENQLTTAFGMYSVENTHERLFSCPFVTSQTKDSVDFAEFKTFNFIFNNNSQPELNKSISEIIQKELINKGLKRETLIPDIHVHIYYSIIKNPNYKPRTTRSEEPDFTYRYDISRDRMIKLPFLSSNTNESEAAYILKFGFRLEDRKLTQGRILWECEANELLNESYSLEEFALIHVPLMSMQYPFVKYGRNVQFRLSKKKYNYTGINFNADNISEIVSVDPYSPAAHAGIRPFDKLDAINDKRMDRTSKQFSEAYRKFLVNTLKYKDYSSQFTDANGFPDCMYWDELKYPLIIKEFNNKKYLTAFSYLYNYEPFINPSGDTSCSFKLKRQKEKLAFIVKPELRTEITVVVD